MTAVGTAPRTVGLPGRRAGSAQVLTKHVLPPVGLLLAALALWEILSRTQVLTPRLFSSPSRIVQTWMALAERDEIWLHAWTTIQELLLGTVIFTVVGSVLGAFLGATQSRFDTFYGPIGALFTLPKVTLAPIFVFVFGLGLWQ
jgi:NitT/TauT family transport system permease protein